MNYMGICKEMFEDNNIEIVGFCDKSTDPKGTPFITLTSGGVKKEGETFPVLFAYPDNAKKNFEDALLTWLNGRRKIYVRMLPEMRETILIEDSLHDDWKKYTYFNVVARLTAY